jgi:hypothetical protein
VLNLSAYLAEIRNRFGRPLSLALESVEASINQLGTVAGIDPTGHVSPPNPPQTISVAAGSDHVHVTLTDSSQRSRALHYFLEWSANDPNFGQPHVEHLGVGRGRVLALPAKDGGGAPINYYFRGYSGYLGSSDASRKVYYGTNVSPTAVTLSGTSTLSLLPSQGSGTSHPQESGFGFGKAQYAKAS